MKNFKLMRARIKGELFTVYLCLGCRRGWRLLQPVDAWQLKSLESHAETHQLAAIPKKRRKKARPADVSKKAA